MKKMLWVFVAVIFCGSLLGSAKLYAADAATSSKDQLAADKAAIKAQKEKMKTDAQAAKAKEKALKDQIQAARTAGDTAKVKELEAQLKSLHKENVHERQQEKKELRDARQKLWKERHPAAKSGGQ